MEHTEVKTSIDGLEVGMFVTRLDRPWIETPFPLEGVRIKSGKDIEQLRKYSNFVYVDVEKGPAPPAKYWITRNLRPLPASDNTITYDGYQPSDTNEFTQARVHYYNNTSTFEEEIIKAREVQKNVSTNLKKVLHDLKSGKSLDINIVKDGVEAMTDSIIRNPSAFSLLVQLEKTDEYSYNHALGTSVWCAQFGRHLGLESEEIKKLALGGMLMDVGKSQLPDELLHKTNDVTPEEFEIIKTHVDHSLKILARLKEIPPDIMRMIATHHERADGSGYPMGLKNELIPMYGKIAGIVDCYDAMTSHRPHNDTAFTPHQAINELYECRESIFQPELIEQFIQTVGLYPTGSLIEISNGEVGVVLEINDMKRLYPTVMIVLDENKQPLDEFYTVDLWNRKQSGIHIKDGLPHGAYGINMNELFI